MRYGLELGIGATVLGLTLVSSGLFGPGIHSLVVPAALSGGFALFALGLAQLWRVDAFDPETGGSRVVAAVVTLAAFAVVAGAAVWVL
ncbi:hypothetical protein [Halomicrococcus gelatinilyticus]|uniref:hypothetical protein n=1 Tax=Halomicrococcus gelatinilyticus TaxID=1702103 RepID=UPI002E15D366